ncbi:MAG TPA: amidohydrolase family protein [Thermoanaerobaculia bacterium]|nr:amidohydrolase family protein [Thermoanaerobaculia bacterium]
MRVAIALMFAAAAAAGAAEPDRYTVLLSGNRAGEETVLRLPSGELRIHFEFNDRGRGPKIDERIDLDGRGWPSAIEITGVDYFKGAVEERFRREGRRATWKSDVEHGEAADGGFYLAFNGAPVEVGLLAAALLRAPDHGVALLPEGRAAIEEAGERTVRKGGASRVVRQYLVTGLDFAPSRVWLDRDGGFFASVSPWLTVVRGGWEGAAADLAAAQDESAAQRQKALAARLAHRAPAIAFTHAALFDSEKASIVPATTVVVSGGRIAAVGRDGAVAIPSGATVIDAAGKTLLPGLWDMHVHLSSAADGLLDIANGITTVRDMGNDPDALLGWKKQFDEGTAVGPRVELAGLVDGSGPYSGPIKIKVDDEAGAKAAVDDYFRRGYAQIKIYSSIKPELMPVIARLAHAHGMRVSGHVPAFMTADQFVREGSDEIQHVNFLFLNFLFDRVKDTRTPARFTEVAEHGAEIDPSQDRVKAFLDLLAAHRTVVDPTLVAFETMFVGKKGTVSPSYTEIADRMPAQIRRGFLSGSLPIPAGKETRYRDSYRSMLRMVKALYDRGIPIVAGTDDLAGFSLARELELYVEAGIPPADVLRIATLGGARVMRRDAERGSIAPGKAADLALVAGDPSARISDIRRVEIVVKDGVLYRPSEIDAVIGVEPLS